ncbi:bacillithiol system redox-active protein YtxJ [Flavobacterium sp.]
MNWNVLESMAALNAAETESFEKPIAIFKHSTRCHISKMALRQFENEFDSEENVSPYFVDLLSHRDISNEIAARYQVMHQSPQLIVIKDGKAVFNTSHENIDAEKLRQF